MAFDTAFRWAIGVHRRGPAPGPAVAGQPEGAAAGSGITDGPGPRCRQLTPLPSGPTNGTWANKTGFGYDPGMASGGEAAGEVGPEEADGLIRGGSLLLDVREDYEWDAGHVSSAVHIPLGLLADHIGELPSDRQVVVVCRSGARSARAAAFLTASGYDAVNLAGGMQAWAAVGLPFVSADGAPGEVA